MLLGVAPLALAAVVAVVGVYTVGQSWHTLRTRSIDCPVHRKRRRSLLFTSLVDAILVVGLFAGILFFTRGGYTVREMILVGLACGCMGAFVWRTEHIRRAILQEVGQEVRNDKSFGRQHVGASLGSLGGGPIVAPEREMATVDPSPDTAEFSPDDEAKNDARFAQIYDRLREKLEREFAGKHVVINIETERYVGHEDLAIAFDKAAAEFGSTDYCWSVHIGAP